MFSIAQHCLCHAGCIPFAAPTIPAEIVTALLNLAEFMEHDDKRLPLDTRTLGALAEKCHAFAKVRMPARNTSGTPNLVEPPFTRRFVHTPFCACRRFITKRWSLPPALPVQLRHSSTSIISCDSRRQRSVPCCTLRWARAQMLHFR